MSKAPISVCMICRNDEKTIKKCIESFRDYVEELIIVDTGSTDGTPQIASAYADKFIVYTECNDSESGLIKNFSAARNKSFELATQPWVMWIDADDVLQGVENLLRLTEEAENACYYFPYEYSYDADGKCNNLIYRERLVRNKELYEWKHPIHEVLFPHDSSRIITRNSNDVVFKHMRQYFPKDRESGRNLRILEKFVKEDPEGNKPRHLYYLGIEYMNNNRINEAYETLEKYVAISDWDEEKGAALLKLVELCIRTARHSEGLDWAFKSIQTNPHWPEGYFAAAKMYYYLAGKSNSKKDWEKCVHFANQGLSIPPVQKMLFSNAGEREYDIHLYLNVALSRLDKVQEALDSANTGLKSKPDCNFLLCNKKLYESSIIRSKIVEDVKKLKELGEDISTLPLQEFSSLNWKSYVRPNDYPKNVSDESFPEAMKTPHSQAWGIPEQIVSDDLPMIMTDAQLQSMVVAIWKEYMLQDEVLYAKEFLKKAPYRIRHTALTEKLLKDTTGTIKWIFDEKQYDEGNTPLDINSMPLNVEMIPFEVPLPEPAGQRFRWISDRLNSNSKLLDMGCIDGEMSNRWASAGHEVTGLDICTNSVRIANETAKRHNLNARHIRTYFKDAPSLLGEEKFDVITCGDVYEHMLDPVNELLKPARQMVSDQGKLLLLTPAGAWYRGKFVDNVHPWFWSSEGQHWLTPRARYHLVAPTVWEVAEHARQAGWWVKNCTVVAQPKPDVPGQGNVAVEAYPNPPHRNGKKVVFYLGDTVEHWTPHTVDITGIGGSETAAIQMCKHLVKEGYEVHIYASCGSMGEGIYDGVEYRMSEKFDDIDTDILIVSRYAPALNANVRAKKKYLWTHDVVPQGLTHETYLKSDRILALSNWHKNNITSCFRYIDPDKILVTRNGIDPERFKHRPNRNPHKVVYASSPDRGLHNLLNMWPQIKSRIPDAELHVFYGFKVWEAVANDAQSKAIKDLQRRLHDMEEIGVKYRGRMNQYQLAWEFLSAGVWAYPTWFSETSCISAMEAQCAGLKIVTSPLAALVETVGDQGVMIPGDSTSQEYSEKFIDAVVDAMQFNEDREIMMASAIDRFNWAGVARDWNEMFTSDLNNNEVPQIAYRSPNT